MKLLIEHHMNNFKEYLKQIKRSENTINCYMRYIEQFSRWMQNQNIEDFKEVTQRHIKNYQQILTEKNYQPHTIWTQLGSIKRLFEYLEKNHQVFMNPCENIQMPKLGKRLPKHVLSTDEIKQLLNAPNTSSLLGIRDKTILEILYSTGIRLSECANLTIHDVDYQGGILRIKQGKNKKDRIVPLGKKACQYLKEYIQKVRPKYVKDNVDERRLFLGRHYRAIEKQDIYITVKKYARLAKLKKPVSTHSLRRSFATHMLKNNANPIYIQRILGHSYLRSMNPYINLIKIDLKNVHQRTHPRENDAS